MRKKIGILLVLCLVIGAVIFLLTNHKEPEVVSPEVQIEEQAVELQTEEPVSEVLPEEKETQIQITEKETESPKEEKETEVQTEEQEKETQKEEKRGQLTQTEGITIPVIGDIKMFEIPDNDAMAFMKDMKCGWNLGNTFDAHNGYSSYSAGISMETSWVGAKTTPELIAAIHEAGFNTIRIPVSWHNHVDENYIIDAEWLDRVREVAGWALDLGMYVIVNTHHDNDVKYYYPDTVHYDQSAAYLSAIWTQMADKFKDCDEHLILESMNEPRLVGTQYEWNWNSSVSECRLSAKYINQLNQLFVDIVRGSGGNNTTRYLAVPAYCAAPWNAADQAFQLPNDIADNRIIVSAHAYTPYNFALNTGSKDNTFDLKLDTGKKGEIASFMNSLYNRFVKYGVPVMMDEFGALDKNGNLQARVNFTAYYVASASARGITCVWWDNHNFTGGGERFGLIERRTLEWVCPDIALAIQANCLYNRK